MLINEYRVPLPLTVEEYQVAQLFTVAELSKNSTGGGDGVQVLVNEPFNNFPLLGGRYNSGQYTYKIYHLASKVPGFIRVLAPKGSLELHEEAWNAYPYCKTVLTNPGYMKDGFTIIIETMHINDNGCQDNVHHLQGDDLGNRNVIFIDIANDSISSSDYKDDEDPKKFKSVKTGRGPLSDDDWINKVKPVMTCYKLVFVEFKWRGMQSRVENFIQRQERRLFTKFHRQLFCLMDLWYGLTMENIRDIEKKTKEELESLRKTGNARGIRAEEA